MKSKTLMAFAVASVFGWPVAFADSAHEVITPSASNESGPVIPNQEEGFSSSDQIASSGAFSDEAGGTLSGSVSEDSFVSDQSAALSSEDDARDEGLALADEGIYSDYYLVSWTPASAESWDYYVIDTGESPDVVSSGEEIYFVSPGYDVVWMPITLDMSADPTGSDEEASG